MHWKYTSFGIIKVPNFKPAMRNRKSLYKIQRVGRFDPPESRSPQHFHVHVIHLTLYVYTHIRSPLSMSTLHLWWPFATVRSPDPGGLISTLLRQSHGAFNYSFDFFPTRRHLHLFVSSLRTSPSPVWSSWLTSAPLMGFPTRDESRS